MNGPPKLLDRLRGDAALHDQRAWAMVGLLAVEDSEPLRIATTAADVLGKGAVAPVDSAAALDLVSGVARLAQKRMKAA